MTVTAHPDLVVLDARMSVRYAHCDFTTPVTLTSVRIIESWGDDDPIGETVFPCTNVAEAVATLADWQLTFGTNADASDPCGAWTSLQTTDVYVTTGHLVGPWTPLQILSIRTLIG